MGLTWVDLKALLAAGDRTAFLSFYAFFRRAAFVPPTVTPLSLEAMLRESVDYARGISDSLKAQVFDALRHLAQGFLDYPGNGLTADGPTLTTITAGSRPLLVGITLLCLLRHL